MNTNLFYKKLIKNLNSDKRFIKENKKNYSYKNIRDFLYIFERKIISRGEKQIRISTLTEKTFRMYSSVASILLTKNVWNVQGRKINIFDKIFKIIQGNEKKINL